jgi:hypothetical protein
LGHLKSVHDTVRKVAIDPKASDWERVNAKLSAGMAATALVEDGSKQALHDALAWLATAESLQHGLSPTERQQEEAAYAGVELIAWHRATIYKRLGELEKALVALEAIRSVESPKMQPSRYAQLLLTDQDNYLWAMESYLKTHPRDTSTTAIRLQLARSVLSSGEAGSAARAAALLEPPFLEDVFADLPAEASTVVPAGSYDVTHQGEAFFTYAKSLALATGSKRSLDLLGEYRANWPGSIHDADAAELQQAVLRNLNAPKSR